MLCAVVFPLCFACQRSEAQGCVSSGRLASVMPPKRKFTISSLPIASKSDGVISKTKQKPIPMAGNMTKIDRRQLQTQRMGGPGPILMCVYQATELASDLWRELDGSDAKLYQVQVKHDANPSVIFDILSNFKDYLKRASASNPQIPSDLKSLTDQSFIKLVLTGADDPDGIGYVRWRVAFYIAGDALALKNFFFLFDGFLMFKAEQMALATPPEVHIHPHADIELGTEHLEYAPYVLHSVAQSLPMGFFDAHPVSGPKRAGTLHFEAQSAQRVNILFGALPYSCRNRLYEGGLAFEVSQDGGDGERFQIMKGVNAGCAADVQQVIKVCTRVLHKLALRIVVTAAPPPESEAAALLQALREVPSLH